MSVAFGALAQLGERNAGSVEVTGSIPVGSTKPSQSLQNIQLISHVRNILQQFVVAFFTNLFYQCS